MSRPLKAPFLASLVLHGVVVALAYFGLPAISSDPLISEVPIVVEVVNVAEQTNLPPPQPEAKPKPPQSEARPEPPKVPDAPPPPPPQAKVEPTLPEPVPTPEPEPQVAALPTPAPSKPKAKERPEPEPETRPEPELKPESKPEPKPEPKPEAQPEPPAPEVPPALLTVQAKAKPKPPVRDSFDSVLKTVEAIKAKQPTPPEPAKPRQPEPERSDFADQIAKVLQRPVQTFDSTKPLSLSEIDAVRQQIAKCWNLPAGAKDAHEMVVEVAVAMNPNGTVRSAQLVSNPRLALDSFYRAFAESALRATLNDRCQPFKLPADKYSHWQTMTLVFNPKEMF